jgi:hypothetical protein
MSRNVHIFCDRSDVIRDKKKATYCGMNMDIEHMYNDNWGRSTEVK